MKKRLQGFLTGVLIGAMLTSGVVLAKQASETINVVYDNIKILIDGKEYQPKDVNGNDVEPFIYNGTTYLPVRAIANAFDKEVDWEPQTSTVTLGNKNYDWLDQMGYADYQYSAVKNCFYPIARGTEASDGMKYDRGIAFDLTDFLDYGTIENNDGTYECYESVSYLLNSNYKTLEGTLSFLGDKHDDRASSIIKIYGDGKMLYTSPVLAYGAKSTNISVDVSNVKLLKIYVEIINVSPDYNRGSIPCIADARLNKK